MPKHQRRATPDPESWEQLELRFTSAEQWRYAIIRPVVLFGQSPAERAATTSGGEHTIYRYTAQFSAEGMRSRFRAEPGDDDRRLPPALRQLIRDRTVEHPPLRGHEIATICYARTGRRLSSHTVQRVFAEAPLPDRTTRRFSQYH